MTEVVDSKASTLVVGNDKGIDNMAGLLPFALLAGNNGLGNNNEALHLANQHSEAATREVLKAVGDSECRTADRIHNTSRATELAIEKTAAATNLAVHTGELRLSKEILKENCDTRQLFLQEQQKTRELIQEHDARRTREDLATLRAEYLALKASCCGPCGGKIS